MASITKKEALRMALKNAAAIVKAADLDSLFGPLYEQHLDDGAALQLLEQSQSEAVRMIEALAAK